jgi:hypothetical protein
MGVAVVKQISPLLAIGLIAAVAPLAACSAEASDGNGTEVPATGSGGERRFAARDFDMVGLSSSADVTVSVGPTFSVVATGSPAMLDRLRVRQNGHSLDLGTKKGVWSGGGEQVHFVVTLPRLTGAAIGGSGSITVDRVAGDSFEGNIGGSGHLTVNNMQVRRASWNIGGSGDITAAGRAGETSVSIGGSGKVRNAGLRADTAEVTIAGAGNVAANAARTADVTIVGSGDVVITGGAKCQVTKMGSGSVRCA